MKRIIYCAVPALLAGLAVAASAQTQPGTQPPSANETAGHTTNADFVRLDTNNDGYLSRKEAAKDKDTARYFSKYDANHDGKLSEEEFNTLKNRKAAEYIDDSKITAEVKAKLIKAEGIKSAEISVATTDGVVTLSGKVESDSQLMEAERIARKVKGVKQVRSTLMVKTS